MFPYIFLTCSTFRMTWKGRILCLLVEAKKNKKQQQQEKEIITYTCRLRVQLEKILFLCINIYIYIYIKCILEYYIMPYISRRRILVTGRKRNVRFVTLNFKRLKKQFWSKKKVLRTCIYGHIENLNLQGKIP